jgi:hypothetical protein
VSGALSAATHAHQETDNGADQENNEEYFRDPGSANRDSTKAEHGGNQSDDEEDYGIVKHDQSHL